MPIRINLLAEAQAAEEARRRDPVKRAIWVAGILIFLMLGWGGIEFSKTMLANSEFQNEENKWKAIASEHGLVKTNDLRAGDLEKKIQALDYLSTNRFLWANALSALQQSLPDSLADQLQFIRFSGNNTYVSIEGSPSRKQDGRTIAGRAAQTIERITLVMEVKDYGSQLDQNFLKLKNAIFNVPFFKTNLGTIEAIQLKTLNQTQVQDADGKSYSTFILECALPEKKREEVR